MCLGSLSQKCFESNTECGRCDKKGRCGIAASFEPGGRFGMAAAYRVAAPSIRIVPWAALASCWPLPQQLLPQSAAGGGRRRCTLGIKSGKSIFYLQFRNACGRFGTVFLWERLRWKASQAHIRLQPFFCVPKGCARAFLGLFRAIRCISGAIHAELLYFCRRSWYTTDTEQCSVQYAIPVIPIEQKTVR